MIFYFFMQHLAIDYCKTLTQEKQAMQMEIQRLKSRILELNESIKYGF